MKHANYEIKKSASIIGAVLGLSCVSAWGADEQGPLVQELLQRLEARDRLIADLQQRVGRLESAVDGKASKTSEKFIVRVNGEVSEALQKTLIKAAGNKSEQEMVARKLRIHNQSVLAQKSQAERGETASQALPSLALELSTMPDLGQTEGDHKHNQPIAADNALAANSAPVAPKTGEPVGEAQRVAQTPVPEKPKGPAGSFEVDEEAAEHALERTLTQAGALLLPMKRAEIQPFFSYVRQEASVPTLVQVGGSLGVASQKIRLNQFNSGVASRFGLPLDSQLELTIPYNIVDRSVVNDFRSFGGSAFDTKSSGSHLGDIQLGLAKTVVREKGWRPDMIARMTWTAPTGVRFDEGVSMGGGFHRVQGSMTMLKRQDPLAFSGRFFYERAFDKSNDNPGDRYGFSIGTVLAASPETSLSVSLDQTFINEIKLDGRTIKGSDQVVSSLVIGAASIFDRDFLFSVSGGIGLTEDSPDYFVNISTPMRFDMPFM